jgi:ABC-type transporter Mla subunit MlaD
MEKLEKCIADLDQLAADLSEKYKQVQAATEALSNAVTTGKGDFVQLSHEVKEASQAYKETHVRSVEIVCNIQNYLRAAANTARKRGVSFPEHVAERPLPGAAEEYSSPQLLEVVQQISSGMRALLEATKAFDILQAQIGEAIDNLKAEMARLEELGAKPANYIETLKSIEGRFADPEELCEQLLQEIETLVVTWHERAEDALERKIQKTQAKLKTALARLDMFKAKSADDAVTLEHLETRLALPESREVLLSDFEKFLNQCQERAREAKTNLGRRSEELATEAKGVLAETHPEMPEALALASLLERRETIKEAELVSYLAELKKSVAEARNAGLNALERYEVRITEDKAYSFTESREVEQIGTAILAGAGRPEQYTGRLWTIGEDVLLRLMLAEFDIQDFYDRFGYPAIARALRVALERNELPRALNFLATEFLPPRGDTSAERIRALLHDSTLRNILEEAAKLDALRLEPEKFDKLDATHHKALLTLMDHDDDAILPLKIRLQWTAMLHSAIPVESDMHRRVSYLFLMALLRGEHYLSCYYSLKVLGSYYPELWSESAFRPLLRHIIPQALVLEPDGWHFLATLCMSPEIAQLAAGDFGSEFLLASLSHYLTIRWGQVTLLNEAWAAWDRLLKDYTTLADVLLGQLQGEQFSDSATLDATELQQQYDNLVDLIADRFTTPGFQGVRLAALIYRWYIDEYLQGWLRRLQSKRLSEEGVGKLLAEVLVRRQVENEDLVEACPLQHNPPQPMMRPIEGRLKNKLNNRLLELFAMLQQVIKIRQRLLSQTKAQVLPLDALRRELSHIYERSESAAWAIDHLLKSVLPFIGELSFNE